jgi:hypothetical protein
MDIVDANKTGVAHEALNNIQRVRKAMTEQEARLILGIGEKSTWEETLQVCFLYVGGGFFNYYCADLENLAQTQVSQPRNKLEIVQLGVNLVLIMWNTAWQCCTLANHKIPFKTCICEE